MYTDESFLIKGKYKFLRLDQVPSRYLLNIYHAKDRSNPDLFHYIESNLSRIMARDGEPVVVKKSPGPCNKMVFFSEKLAKEELHRIKDVEQEHKKPRRAYECSRCGGWHLTSIPYEKWYPEQKPAGVLHRIEVESLHRKSKNPSKRRFSKSRQPCKPFSFATEKEARYALHQAQRRDLDPKNPIRAFACEKCGLWHLSPVPYTKWEAGPKRPISLNQLALTVYGN